MGCARGYRCWHLSVLACVELTSAGNKILLVDDSKTVLLTLRTHLMGKGFEFLEANNGRAALRLALRERPALVITDVEMPEMNGLDLCRAIRAAPGLIDTKLVLVSSRWTLERVSEAEALRVTVRLAKPIDGRRLAANIANWFL